MKVCELHQYLLSLVDLPAIGCHKTIDRIIIGDPQLAVTKVGVCWLPYLATLQKAHHMGINTIITHEPTFYTHMDLDESMAEAEPERQKKLAWVHERGLAIIRCHDILDAVQGWGIPFALGRALGFTDRDMARSRTYYNVYRYPKPMKAIQAARYIVKKLRRFGQKHVCFTGDPERMVATIGVGTGCYSNPLDLRDLGADLYIALHDSVHTWIQPVLSRDYGLPLVIIDHGVSEEPGVIALTEHLRAQFKAMEFVHFPQGHTYTWV